LEQVGIASYCPVCGASLEAAPDTVVYICSYCGWAGPVEGEAVELVGLMPASADEVGRDVAAFLQAKAGRDARVRDIKVLMLPFWVVRQRVRTQYNGYRRETRGTERNRYTIYIPVRGEFDEEMTTVVYARTFEAVFGLSDVKDRILSRLGEFRRLDPVRAAKSAKLIGPEVSEREAVDRAKTIASEAHRRRAEGMTSKLFDCYTEAEPISSTLIMYPVANVSYEWEKRIYKVSADASINSTDRVLKAELPITASRRLLTSLATAGIVLLIALASILSQAVLGSGFFNDDGMAALIAIALPPVAAAAAGWLGSRRATAEQRVWRRGRKSLLPEVPTEVGDIMAKLRGEFP
jgi:hypothetical protein